MEDNPVLTISKDGLFTLTLVYTSAETTTDSNSHQARSVNLFIYSFISSSFIVDN